MRRRVALEVVVFLAKGLGLAIALAAVLVVAVVVWLGGAVLLGDALKALHVFSPEVANEYVGGFVWTLALFFAGLIAVEEWA